MPQQTTGLYVNPSDETIRVGSLTVRFLFTADHSRGSVAAFELAVPAAQRLSAPAHSHDHYEETIYGLAGVVTWTVDGNPIDVGPGQALCIPRGSISPVRQPRQPGREGALRHHSGGDWSPVFSRDCRRVQRGGRWTPGPRVDGADLCAATALPRPRPPVRLNAEGHGHMSSVEIIRVARSRGSPRKVPLHCMRC